MIMLWYSNCNWIWIKIITSEIEKIFELRIEFKIIKIELFIFSYRRINMSNIIIDQEIFQSIFK